MNAIELLSGHNLKRTGCREGIIDVMISAGEALSEYTIRDRLTGHYDRTTFYRSFKTLEEHQIVHKIVIDQQIIKYALNHFDTPQKGHVHFYCNNCNTVKCLESVSIEDIRLPEGFSGFETEVIVKGKCANCKNDKENL